MCLSGLNLEINVVNFFMLSTEYLTCDIFNIVHMTIMMSSFENF